MDPSAPETTGDQKVKRSPLFVILLTVFINLVGFGIIIPLIPFYAQDFGASKFEVGLLFASYSLMQFLFAPLWGRISDRIGRRPILLISLFGTSLSFVVFGLANSLLVLFIGRIMAGFFGAVISTAHAFIADVTEPQDRAHGMGLVGAAFGLGFIFGPFIGGVMADLWGYAAPAYFAAALALVNMILAWFVLPESYPASARKKRDPADSGLGTSLRKLREALVRPYVGGILLIYFIVSFAMANMETTYALLTEELWGWGAKENGLIFGYIGLMIVFTQGFAIRPLARRFGEERLVIAGSILLIPSLGLMPFSPGLAVLMILSGVMAIGSGINTPSLNSLISRSVSPEEQGGIMGITQSLGGLARVIGPIWGGFTFSLIGHSAPYWTAAILMGGACLLAVQVFRKRSPPPPS
ncbi:MFS transporter [Gemmatimonadota bacterium]